MECRSNKGAVELSHVAALVFVSETFPAEKSQSSLLDVACKSVLGAVSVATSYLVLLARKNDEHKDC